MNSPFRFVVPAPDIVWRSRIEAGAFVYLVGTSLQFVTPGSSREAELIAGGALCVATLRFDQDLRERSHPGRPVRVFDDPAALEELRETFGSPGQSRHLAGKGDARCPGR